MKLAAGTPAEQRRQFLMLGLLIVIGAWFYFAPPWGGAPMPGPRAPAGTPGLQAEILGTASNTPAAAPRGQAQSQAPVMPEPLKLAALKAVSDETESGRDPFGFGIPPRPPAPPPPPVVARPTPTPTPYVPPGPPPRPKIPVKFLGFAEDPSRPGKLVSLSVNGTVVVAREGDVVDGKYRLLKVELTSIVMAYLDGEGQLRIPLTGG